MTPTVTSGSSEAAETVVRLMGIQMSAEAQRRRDRILYDKPIESEGFVESLVLTNPVMATLAVLASVEAATDGWLTKQWRRIVERVR